MLYASHCRCNIPPLSFTTKFVLYYMMSIVISGFHTAILVSVGFFGPALTSVLLPFLSVIWKLSFKINPVQLNILFGETRVRIFPKICFQKIQLLGSELPTCQILNISEVRLSIFS